MSEATTLQKEKSPALQEIDERLYCMNFAYNHLSPTEAGSMFALIASNPALGNITDHCAKAAVITDTLCDELGIKDKEPAIKAAALHDVSKPREIQLHAQAYGWTEPQDPDKWMRDLEKDSRYHNTALETSDEVLSLMDAVVPKTSMGPTSLREMVVWYPDAALSGTKLVEIEERMRSPIKSANARSQRAVEMDRYYEEKYDYGDKTFREVQIAIGKRVSGVFRRVMATKGGARLESRSLTTILEGRMKERMAGFSFAECLEELGQKEKGLKPQDWDGKTHIENTKEAFYRILNPEGELSYSEIRGLSSQDLLSFYEDLK